MTVDNRASEQVTVMNCYRLSYTDDLLDRLLVQSTSLALMLLLAFIGSW